MAGVTTARLKLNPPLERMPVLQFCRPGELRIDPAYQRDVTSANSAALIRRIAQHWNWDLCQPLVVARRTDLTERLFVIDGQHRLAAARLRGDIDQLPCVILDLAQVADEAASFVHLNQQRKPLTRLDLFRAAAASEDPQALAIDQALRAAGLALAPHSNYTTWQPGMVSHIGGIVRAWERQGPAVATRALDALGQGFAGQVQRYCGTLYRGIARVCQDEIKAQGSFEGDRFTQFVALLWRHTQDEWYSRISRHFADHPEMFRVEASEGLLRQEWRGAQQRIAPSASRPPPGTVALPAPVKREGFGLGASDDLGAEEWAWCRQCDSRRTRSQARACGSRYCAVRQAA